MSATLDAGIDFWPNICSDMVGEWNDPQDLVDAQDYLAWLIDQEEDDDIRNNAVNNYIDLAFQYGLLDKSHIQRHIDIDSVFPTWVIVKDGHPAAREIFERHYSANKAKRQKKKTKLFVGPGQKMVMLTPRQDALFVWRLTEFRKDNQYGAECSVFRNESVGKSSDMILEAEKMALERWPFLTRFFTYVDPPKIKSSNPGYCYQKAGYRKIYKNRNGLLLLHKNVVPPGIYYQWRIPPNKNYGVEHE